MLDLSITTDPGIGPSIDQEKTLSGTADPDHCVEAGVERGEGGTIGSLSWHAERAFVIRL